MSTLLVQCLFVHIVKLSQNLACVLKPKLHPYDHIIEIRKINDYTKKWLFIGGVGNCSRTAGTGQREKSCCMKKRPGELFTLTNDEKFRLQVKSIHLYKVTMIFTAVGQNLPEEI